MNTKCETWFPEWMHDCEWKPISGGACKDLHAQVEAWVNKTKDRFDTSIINDKNKWSRYVSMNAERAASYGDPRKFSGTLVVVTSFNECAKQNTRVGSPLNKLKAEVIHNARRFAQYLKLIPNVIIVGWGSEDFWPALEMLLSVSRGSG